MQRKLFIIRHGKSSWDAVVGDSDRPLNERGVKNGYEIATRLLNAGLVPEAVFSSPAIRALHTAIIMSKIWGVKEESIFIRNELYLPEIDDIAKVVFEIPDTCASVAIFGHNPGFTEFVNQFLVNPIDNLPTAGVAVVTMEADSWNDLFNGSKRNVHLEFPGK